MEKQEAVQYVLEQLGKNRSPAEITAELSQKLGAPQTVVEVFVQRVQARYVPAPPPTPSSLEDEPQQASEISTTPVDASREVVGEDVRPAARDVEPAPAPSTVDTPSQAPAWDAQVSSGPTTEILSPENEIRLEKLILSAVSKNRRQSDVVMMVCERTGMSWEQAQRLVAKTIARNRKRLDTRENLIVIPLSLAALIGGLILLFATWSDLYTFISLYGRPEATAAGMVIEINRYTLWAAIAGATLVLGAIAGLAMAIRKYFD